MLRGLKKGWLLLIGGVALGGLAALLFGAWPGRTPAIDEAAVEQRALRAAMKQIIAERRALSAPPTSVPPTQLAPIAPTTEAPGPAVGGVEDSAVPTPVPPEGFSFVEAPLPMAKAPLAPDESPPATEPETNGLDWLGTAESLALVRRQAERAQRDWSFGWLRLARDVPASTVAAALRTRGGELLGAAGHLARVRLPADQERLRAVHALPFVAAVGAMPTLRKLMSMPNDTFAAGAGEQTPVLITLMTDDADGRWRRALEDMGAAVGRFRADIRVYPANVDAAALRAIAAADFVAAVQPVGVARAAHDLAVPAMGADGLRTFSGSPGMFSGAGAGGAGASVPVGVMDTGLNINHLDISSNRQSICGVNFQNDEDFDLWLDEGGHGTHVTGTLLGNGYHDPQFAGVAPGVQHIRFAKVLGIGGGGTELGIWGGMDYFAAPSSCAGGASTAALMPLIVNMSLSADSLLHEGTGAEERKVDGLVWAHRQLYVVVQGNREIYGFSGVGSAKNTLAVGAVRNDGELAAFSSRGPTFDGRLQPQVVASGVQVRSAKGKGSEDGYFIQSGTSMATPAVAGVAALLMDASAAHKEQPALVRARLMASAIKPDAWLEGTARFPAHNSDGPGELQDQYGLGKVSAHTSVLNRDAADGWLSGSGVSEPQGGEYAWQNVVVPAGASRLDLVLTWDEPPAEPVGRTVLNDLDLWLDADGDCGSGACGEHSSRSRKDNVEWIIVRNPAPGTYRAKVAAHRVYGAAPRAALAWTVIRGPSTPTLDVRADKTILRGYRAHDLRVSVSTDGYVAAGARLVASCRAADGTSDCEAIQLSNLRVNRQDGVPITEPNAARSDGIDDLVPVPPTVNLAEEVVLPLGEVVVGEVQTVDLTVSYAEGGPSDAVRLYFTVSAWNAVGASLAVDVVGSGDRAAGNPVPPPDNDHFASAATLADSSGSREFDLLRSTTGPGEVLYQTAGATGFPGMRAYDIVHSLWYLWRAPSTGLYRFSTRGRGVPGNLAVDAFGGDRLADLERLAHGNSGAVAFFAEAGQRLYIRISMAPQSAQGTLHWAQGLPENDDFANATSISGAQGRTDGDNGGAGMELGEWFGSAAATVWFRWTAPRDGDFGFDTERLHNAVMVFVGNTVSDLRLVSGYPGPGLDARIRARDGDVYHVAVATRDGKKAGLPFTLIWSSVDVAANLNFFATAEEVPGESSAGHDVRIDEFANVEPGEPASTGVRTNWWAWTAPAAGRFTWRLTRTGGLLFRIAAWSGDAMADAQLEAISDERDVTPEFVLDAAAGQRYRISLGFLADDGSAFDYTPAAGARLEWAPTPANDGLAMAIAISGARGEISGDNGYATTEPDEAGGRLGHSSLWWDFRAPSSGAYRFQADGPGRVLAVYRRDGDGYGGLAFLASGDGDVTFTAAADAHYAIRVGSRGVETGGFTLRWHAQNADGAASHTVPFFPAAANESDRESPDHELIEGFARVFNRSERRGDVEIQAFDDAGQAAQDTVTVHLEARQKVHFNSRDLERGTQKSFITGAVGDGQGDWRLRLTSDLDVEVAVYARALPSGFLTSLHDRAPCVANRCEVVVFNPARNQNQRSLLRLVNSGDADAAVTIDGVDDNGASPGTAVRLQLPAGTARTLTAVDLETGNGAGLTGALGGGSGKWELIVEADRQIHVLSLMRSPSGHLTNLSSIVR